MAAPGLENGLRVLEYVAEHGNAGFSELVRELEINKASLSRFLKVLVTRGYLEKQDTRYLPGWAFSGVAFSGERPWEPLIAPALAAIAAEVSCSSLWVEFRRGRLCFIDRFISEHGVNMQTPGNTGMQYLINPAGYILLASATPGIRAKLIESAEYTEAQRLRLPSAEEAEVMIAETEREDFFDDRGRIYPDIHRGAVPLRWKGRLFGAMVLARIHRADEEEAMREALEGARRAISRYVGP